VAPSGLLDSSADSNRKAKPIAAVRDVGTACNCVPEDSSSSSAQREKSKQNGGNKTPRREFERKIQKKLCFQ